MKKFIIDINYTRLLSDYSIFVYKNDIIIAIYVDDLLICDFKKVDIYNFKKKLVERFRIKNLDFILFYLRVKITRNRKNRVIYLNQTTYIKNLIVECDLIDCKSVVISMKQTSLKLNIFNNKKYYTTSKEITSYAKIQDKLQ